MRSEKMKNNPVREHGEESRGLMEQVRWGGLEASRVLSAEAQPRMGGYDELEQGEKRVDYQVGNRQRKNV